MLRSSIAVLAWCAACNHHPTHVAWTHVELGHGTCGWRARIKLTLDGGCALAIEANTGAPRRVPLDRAACESLFELADDAAHRKRHDCTAPKPFIAGAEITVDDRVAYACWDDPLASHMAALADRLAPGWRDGPHTVRTCDFEQDTIEGVLVVPGR